MGTSGTDVISCISGLILAALGVETILQGYRATFALPLIGGHTFPCADLSAKLTSLCAVRDQVNLVALFTEKTSK
jgi:hypothetical protein